MSDGGSGERESEGEDDGRYVKETCVRVSHQPVSQCVDVTLMQMACAGIHPSATTRRRNDENALTIEEIFPLEVNRSLL